MRKLILFTITLAMSAMLAACGSKSGAEDILREAEMAISQGDMEVATSVAQHLTDSTNLSGLSASQLARLSIIYMELADSADNSDSADKVAIATDAYRRAFMAQPDSAAAFYSSLPADKVHLAMTLSQLADSPDGEDDEASCDNPDSLCMSDCELNRQLYVRDPDTTR